jgi:8-oxo-dGTP diphosphatase
VETSRIIVVAGLIWLANRRILVQQRANNGKHGAGSLEFPGGKVEIGEDPKNALARELREECGAAAQFWCIGPVAEIVHHIYPPPGPEVILLLYHVDARQPAFDLCPPVPLEGAKLEAISVRDLDPSRFLSADLTLVSQVREGVVSCPFA